MTKQEFLSRLRQALPELSPDDREERLTFYSEMIDDQTLAAAVTTGDAVFTDAACGDLISGGTTGTVSVRNTKVTGQLLIERTTGDIRLDASDAAEIRIHTTTGNVSGTLLSDKVFFTETSTGRVSVPQSSVGGKCEIHTTTGNIEFSVR